MPSSFSVYGLIDLICEETYMKHLYLVENEKELRRYQRFVAETQSQLENYITFLKKRFAVNQLPNAILWTNAATATKEISNIPVPAYTNDFRVVMAPDTDAWRMIYLRQLDGLEENDVVNKIRSYYLTALNQRHILQILGHELAHHSELFLEDFNSGVSDGIWFEEGMAEYISRRYFLSTAEFEAASEINQLLVDLLTPRFGTHSLENFGASTYSGDYASIFFEYWRSFLAVNSIIDKHHGNIHSVFQSYHEWNRLSTGQNLAQWFGLDA